jgi:hypothetical protein
MKNWLHTHLPKVTKTTLSPLKVEVTFFDINLKNLVGSMRLYCLTPKVLRGQILAFAVLGMLL